jgi:hypothetical protein
MAENDSPTLKLNELRLNENVEITLPSSRPGATGTNKFGEWNLWVGKVKEVTAYEDRGKGKKLEKYTGEVVFFPSKKTHEQIVKLVGDDENVTIKVTKTAGESKRGVFTKYEVEKVGAGNAALTSLESELVSSVKELVSSGAAEEITEKMFITGAATEPYNFDEKHAKELYDKYIQTGNRA